MVVTVEALDTEAGQARVDAVRRDLGNRLVTYRKAAGFTQCTLAEAIGMSRTVVVRAETGQRGMRAEKWAAADEVCGAGGDLVAAHGVLAAAECDHRARVRLEHRAAQLAAAQAEVDALRASPVPLGVTGHVAVPGLTGVSGELAKELRQVLEKLARKVGRREAMRVGALALAAFGTSDVDPDEYARVAQALNTPRRVDPQVVRNLAGTLAHCKRQEDALGPSAVLPTVVVQHGVVRSLLERKVPEVLTRPLLALESDMASAIGSYLVDLDDLDGAARYFRAARKAGHDAHNPACAAYAAVNMSFVACLSGEAHTAMDAATVARSLAARTDDPHLKALAEQMAADAYALDGDHGRCLAAYERAKELLAGGKVSSPASPAYWVHEGSINSRLSVGLSALRRPRDAVEAARNALARSDRSYAGMCAFAQVRLGAALVVDREIGEAARVLGDAAGLAGISPRVTAELRAARAGMAPWQATPAVKALDEQLAAYGIVLN